MESKEGSAERTRSRVALIEVASIPSRFYVDESSAWAIDNVLPREIPLDGRDPLKVLSCFFSNKPAAYALFDAGQRCPRIWRFLPQDDAPVVEQDDWFGAFINGLQQVELLTDALNEIFRVVQPAADTTHVYGAEIRSLLILACTEVEAQCKAVLKANHVEPAAKNYTTRDYARLRHVMGLDEYRRALCRFPEYPEIRPFEGWDAEQASKSLPWYDAYNKTKHDREENLRCATLANAISAVAAVEVLLRAQFGRRAHETHSTRSALRTLEDKAWSNIEGYHRPRWGERWTSVDFPQL